MSDFCPKNFQDSLKSRGLKARWHTSTQANFPLNSQLNVLELFAADVNFDFHSSNTLISPWIENENFNHFIQHQVREKQWNIINELLNQLFD